MTEEPVRCAWAQRTPLETAYHDNEWGVPLYNDAGQFEFLVLESAQAGLSWSTILNKREGYRKAFAGFDPTVVAAFTQKDVEHLMQDSGIVRNRRKIKSAIGNARLFLELAAKHGSFTSYIWSFVDGSPIINAWTDQKQVPPVSSLSDTISRELKRLGFTFLGSVVVYAHMQATGIVNDHLTSCYRYRELLDSHKKKPVQGVSKVC